MRRIPSVQQPPGSRGCLPAAVLSALLWEQESDSEQRDLTFERVAEWCGLTGDGCLLDLAISGLRAAGFDIEDLTGCSISAIEELLADDEYFFPIIATLVNPYYPSGVDHAVVLFE